MPKDTHIGDRARLGETEQSGTLPEAGDQRTKITDMTVLEIVKEGRQAADDIASAAAKRFREDFEKIHSPAMRRSVLLNVEERLEFWSVTPYRKARAGVRTLFSRVIALFT